MGSNDCLRVVYMTMTMISMVTCIDYAVEISLEYLGGSTDNFWFIIQGSNGQTAAFAVPDGLLADTSVGSSNTFAFTLRDDLDVGVVTHSYLVTFGENALRVDEVSINAAAYSVSEFTAASLAYTQAATFPNGCGVLVVDYGADNFYVEEQVPVCTTIAAPENVSNTTSSSSSSAYEIYAIEVEVAPQGGSVHEIYAGIQGIGGARTEFISIGVLDDAGNSGATFAFDLNVSNVGVAHTLMLLHDGGSDDALFVHACSVNGARASELTFDRLAYEGGYDPRGCGVLICDVVLDELTVSDEIPCPNYAAPSISNRTRWYTVVIEIVEQGGSVNDAYVVIEGQSGRRSDAFNVGAMSEGGRQYSFDFAIDDIGDARAIYVVKLASDGDDALLIKGCETGEYATSEFEGDLLQYTGDDLRGCAYVKCDFLSDEMSTNEENICNIIPFITTTPIIRGNDSFVQYFIAIDTTNIPFSVPGGTQDPIYVQITNEALLQSEYVALNTDGTQLNEDGEIFSFRANLSSDFGDAIRRLDFVHFGDDDLCIDYCQINGQSVALSVYDAVCSENDIDDNDACSILTCDFQLNQITAVQESPCTHDVFGWRDKSYRVYSVVVDVCESFGNTIDTWSLNPFWIYVQSAEYGMSDTGTRIDDLGRVGENVITLNLSSSIGTVDKLLLVHYNNDDVCIWSIAVDGFEVSASTWINSEYDCEYDARGCNVITADFETNELSIESHTQCPFTPSDLDVQKDTCLDDKVDDWAHRAFGFSVSIAIALLSVAICCCGVVPIGIAVYACCRHQHSKQNQASSAVQMETY